MRKGFSLVELLVVIAIIAALAGVAYGPIISRMKEADKTNAIANGRNIHTALLSFASNNDGLFPNEDTANSSESGDSAEGNFTQLLNDGGGVTEDLFWNSPNINAGTVSATKPNNDGQLTSGENCWGYVANLSSSSNPRTPLFFDSSSQAGTFTTGVWDGRAIVGKVDGSVTAMEIDYGSGGATEEDGTAKSGNIIEKRGSSKIDIFSESNLPKGAEVQVPR